MMLVRSDLFDVECVDENDVDKKLSELVKTGGFSVALNAEKIIRISEDSAFKGVVSNSVFPYVDGIAVNWFLKKKGQKKTSKLNLPVLSLRFSNKNSLRVCIVGATKQNNDNAVENIKRDYPGISQVYGIDGYREETEINAFIAERSPDLVLVGMGSPKQELLCNKLSVSFTGILFIPCGGAIDVASGVVKRAPKVIQKLGIESFYRLALDPRRFPRYARILKIFPILWRY